MVQFPTKKKSLTRDSLTRDRMISTDMKNYHSLLYNSSHEVVQVTKAMPASIANNRWQGPGRLLLLLAATYQNDFPICHLLGWIEFCVANKLWSHLKLSTPPVIYYYLYTYLLLQFLKTKGHLFWWCHFTSVKNFLTSFWDDYSYTYCPTGVVSWLPLTSIYRYVTYSQLYI